ncbi:hypothetical protein D3C75_930630 [compost metagenome]
MQLAVLGDLLQLALQLPDPVADMPPVGLQLGFTGPPGADAAAETGQILAMPDKPGKQIAVLCQLHLQNALPGFRPPGENIQNQLGTVNDFHIQRFLQITDLNAGELLVEYRRLRIQFPQHLLQLLHLALADQPFGIRLIPVLLHGFHYRHARCFCQADQLLQGVFR